MENFFPMKKIAIRKGGKSINAINLEVSNTRDCFIRIKTPKKESKIRRAGGVNGEIKSSKSSMPIDYFRYIKIQHGSEA